MQTFGALVMAAVTAAAIPAAPREAVRADAPMAVAEAYVAVLDADWNVTREIRVACPAEAGCAVDLALAEAGLAAVHVRFDPLRSGAVAVSSRLEGRDGSASAAEDKTLSLDRTGFGADHYEARLAATGPDGPIIMMAVKVPGWTAPATHLQQPT
jgi:hypothetical protein